MTHAATAPKGTRKLSAEELKKMREEGHRKVKGVFRSIEVPGGSCTFSFKMFRGDDVEQYTLEDGKIYELPLMVAKHINNNCSYPVHSHVLDAAGNPVVSTGKTVKRFSFESLDFMDVPEDDA